MRQAREEKTQGKIKNIRGGNTYPKLHLNLIELFCSNQERMATASESRNESTSVNECKRRLN